MLDSLLRHVRGGWGFRGIASRGRNVWIVYDEKIAATVRCHLQRSLLAQG